ncbi:DUF7835 family putative zinc beta-ribbon protein [Halegenticoccus soli]|uniref:DUF7835 family putative zinc beta-ribbon protein n=1 Tax=Halegenticoccus soli TaxID=1985678 RepID=UPI000C6D091B|nr:hypothetical protein [Halegenticoccus soli]
MSEPADQLKTVIERCSRCDRETEHRVSIDLVTESDRDRNTEFSREPYRVSECVDCGTQQTQRMNNA